MTGFAALLRLSPAGPFDADRVGRRMAALYRVWDGRRAPDLTELARCLLSPLGVIGEPIGTTCLAAAAAVMQWGGTAYHSARHHAEVATNAQVLAELAAYSGDAMPAYDRAVLLTAALSHDYLYQPDAAPFGAEQASADAVDAIARRCGAGQPERDDLRSLILATAPGFRPVLANATVRPDQPVPQALRDLLARPRLAALAATLSDADLLSSAGLSMRWQQVQHVRLEREMCRTMTYQEDLAFLDRLVGPTFLSAPGRCFTPNLTRIRAVCADLAGAGAMT